MADRAPGTSKHPFALDRFFAFRTPLLPHGTREAWGADLRAADVWEDASTFPEAYAADRALLRARLREVVERPEVQEALFVASPDLVDSLPRWIKEPESSKGQRTETALVRYFNRMCHRPTPFGLFAGHSLGRLGEVTRIETVPREHYVRRTRLDFDYLCGLVEEVQKDKGLRETLVYRPNSSLYASAGRLRYTEARIKEEQRTLHLVALNADEYLEKVLQTALPGAGLKELAQVLVSDEITLEEAVRFIHELVDNQVLVSNLEPATTGPEPLANLIRVLSGAPSTQPIAERLAQAQTLLAQLDRDGLGQSTEPYRNLMELLEALPGKVERSKLLQVDLFKPAPQATLGPGFRADMERAIDLLQKLTPKREKDPFKDFKESFSKRYEQRWVPLMEALDPECGVGFSGANGITIQGAPILEALTLGAGGGRASQPVGLQRREAWLLRRLVEMRCKGEDVLDLSETDLQALKEGNEDPLPVSFSSMVEVAAASPEAFAQGDYLAYVHSASGPSAARILGRFCHGDPELCAEVVRHLGVEEASQPGAVFAEIAHLPYGRMGNVMARPLLRSYEIPFLGASGADLEHQIPISDLYVGIVGKRVVLWSRRLDREVVPRLSSAANYNHRATDIYRFLAMLQDQGSGNWAGWTWGALEQEPWLPRVQYGKVVLGRAQWRLKEDSLKPLKQAKDAPARFQAFQALRRDLRLPRHTLLADSDNELPLDFQNPLSLEAIWSTIKQRDQIRLVEDFPGGHQLVASGPEGAFTHELVLTGLAVPEIPQKPLPSPAVHMGQERYMPGSEWLYVKLYAGLSTADHLLTQTLSPLVRETLAAGEADRWFFIRYSDPDPHLRLRFHGDPERLTRQTLPRLRQALEPLIGGGWLWRFQVDTYEPETGRYGGPEGLPLAEKIFQADSEATLAILDLYPGDEGSDTRWRLALASADAYYDGLDLDIEARLRLAETSRDKYAKEFEFSPKTVGRKLGDTYRAERKALESLLDPASADTHPLAAGLHVLTERSARLKPLFNQMRTLHGECRLNQTPEAIVPALIHMSLNRLLRSAARMQEAVVYDFLARSYQTAEAQASADRTL